MNIDFWSLLLGFALGALACRGFKGKELTPKQQVIKDRIGYYVAILVFAVLVVLALIRLGGGLPGGLPYWLG